MTSIDAQVRRSIGHLALGITDEYAETIRQALKSLEEERDRLRKELDDKTGLTAIARKETVVALTAERDRLKADLAEACEVIKPFSEHAQSLSQCEDDDAVIVPDFFTDKDGNTSDLVVADVGDLRRASQFMENLKQ